MDERTKKIESLPQEIDENLLRVADRQRIVTGPVNQVEFAIRETRRDFLREPEGKGAILFSVPKPNRHTHFFERKTPGVRINLRIGHQTRGG